MAAAGKSDLRRPRKEKPSARSTTGRSQVEEKWEERKAEDRKTGENKWKPLLSIEMTVVTRETRSLTVPVID